MKEHGHCRLSACLDSARVLDSFRMKTSFFPVYTRRCGFTLIELLVVIAILGTLAGITLSVVFMAKSKGNNTVARQTCTQIATAAERFMSDNDQAAPFDYNAFPSDDERLHFPLAEGKDGGMLRVLLDAEGDVDSRINRRRETYLKVNEVDSPTNGVYYQDDEPGYYDPWGTPYYVIYTENKDVNVDPFAENGRPLNDKFLVYSLGEDQDGIAPIPLSNDDSSASSSKKSKKDAKKSAKDKKADKDKKKGGKDKKKGKDDKKKQREEAAAALEDIQEAIEDNVYSWKES